MVLVGRTDVLKRIQMFELESGGTVVSWDNFEQMGTWKGKQFMIVLTYSVQRMEYFYYFQGTFVTPSVLGRHTWDDGCDGFEFLSRHMNDWKPFGFILKTVMVWIYLGVVGTHYGMSNWILFKNKVFQIALHSRETIPMMHSWFSVFWVWF